MPQICSSFPDELFNEIQLRAKAEDTKHSKMVVSLVELALHRLPPLESELTLAKEQLGLALQNQQQFQEEIMPALKLLTPAEQEEPKPSRWRWFRNR